jgi:hypothetical protein
MGKLGTSSLIPFVLYNGVMDNKLPNSEPNENGPLPPHDLRLVATAYHEAGHAVMALSVGRSIEKVTVSPAHLNSGGIRLGACKIQKGRKKSSNDFVEDDALILFAGMVAESHVTDRYCERGAAQDIAAAKRILATRADNPRQLDKVFRRLLDKTAHILAEPSHAQAIASIAKELLLKETISGRAARHLFETAIQQNAD